MRWLALLAVFLALPSGALAFDVVGPTQAGVSQNQVVVSVADTAVAATIAASANQRGRIYGLTARCSAGTATLTVTNGGTTVWSSSPGLIGTSSIGVAFIPVPIMGSLNSAFVATLGSCGGGNTGTLSLHGDRY